jgi:hypothetical protein
MGVEEDITATGGNQGGGVHMLVSTEKLLCMWAGCGPVRTPAGHEHERVGGGSSHQSIFRSDSSDTEKSNII